MEFTSPGFDAVKLEQVEVNANQEVVIIQPLPVAKASTAVEVTEVADDAALVKAAPTIGLTLPGSFVESIPLTADTRDVTRLALLTPGVSRGPGGSEFSASGQRARNNNFMIDGVDNNDLTTTTVTARVIPEAVAEFQTQTTPYSAEFGRNSGAQVSVITRGGSNAFHGAVWDYHRANWMEPLSLLNKRAGLTSTPRYVENQVGASLGARCSATGPFSSDLSRRTAAARRRTRATPTLLRFPLPPDMRHWPTCPSGPAKPCRTGRRS